MTPEDVAVAKHRLAKAAETVAEAHALLEAGFVRGAVNREYYACFYAVSALLLTEGLASSKHSGVKSMFNQNWVKTGLIPTDVASIYNRLFERRQLGDYTDTASFERADAATWLSEANYFVHCISDWMAGNTEVRD